MEITAALLLPIASMPQGSTEAPQQFLFTDVLSEAVSMEPVEPSAWTLLNPIVLPEDSDPKLVEPAAMPEEREQVVLVPLQPPALEPKMPLQLQLPSKELTAAVKKLPLENAALEFLRDNSAVSIDEQQEIPGARPPISKEVAPEEQKVPQLVAFTARVSKAHVEAADAGTPLKPLRSALPHLASTSELRVSKLGSDADQLRVDSPIPFVQAWQPVETEKPVENTVTAPASSLAPISEQSDIRSAEPVRQISLDVEGVEGQLRIRIAERAGEMRAWVTGQAQAAVEKVQAGLSDLTRALSNAGFESEVWAPQVISAPASASDLQASTEQNDQNLFGGSHSDTSENRDGSQDNRRPPNDDEDDEHNFQSHMRIF